MPEEKFNYFKETAKRKLNHAKEMVECDIELLKIRNSNTKYPVHPTIVESKSELACSIQKKDKVIYVVGRYWYDAKHELKKSNISLDSIDAYREKKEAENELEEQRKKNASTGEKIWESTKTVLSVPVKIVALPFAIIGNIFGIFDDVVELELKNYKIRANKMKERLELVRIKGESKFNSKYDYIDEK